MARESPIEVPIRNDLKNVLCVSLCSLQGISKEEPRAIPLKNDTVQKEHIFRKLLKNRAFRRRVLYSAFVCGAFMLLGWARGQLGSAFLDLQQLTSVDLGKGSGFMTSYYVGRVVGSLLGGVLYDRVNKNIVFGLSVTLNGFTFGTIPWCFIYESMIVAHFLNGTSAGSLDVAVNAEAMSFWGRKCRSFIQVLWVLNTVASILSPIATAPFLMKGDETKHLILSTPTGNDTYTLNPNMTSFIIKNTTVFPEESRLYIPYSISAATALLVAFPFFMWFVRSKERFLNEKYSLNDEKEISKPPKRGMEFVGALPRSQQYVSMLNAGLFAAIQTGVDFTFSGFLPLFCVQHLNWTKVNGALLSSAYFLSNLVGRLIGVFIVRKISSIKLLGLTTVMTLAAFVSFTLTSFERYVGGVWISTCFLGLGVSVMFPTFLTWTNLNVVKVSGRIASYLVVSSLVGALLNPVILTMLMIELGSIFMCYLMLGETLLMALCVCYMISYTIQLQKHKNNEVLISVKLINEEAKS